MSKKQKISTELAQRQTFRSTIDRVEFDHAVPVRRPDLDPKRDLPQPTYRPGALDYMNIPSRGVRMNTILTDDERPELPSPVYGPDTQVDEDSDGAYTVEQMEAYADAREAAVLAKLARQEPVAMRYDFDGYGYQYIDSGSGSDWRSRIPDAEAVYAAPQQADRQRVPEGWIETSKAMPPSGQVVLACYKNELGNTRRIRAQWVAAKTSEASIDSDCGEYDEATDTYYDPEGWYECIDNWDCYSSVFVSAQITHWMPLPAAPGAAPEAPAQAMTIADAANHFPDGPFGPPVLSEVGVFRNTLRLSFDRPNAPAQASAVELTVESIRTAGGIVHKDGNIFFTNIEQARAALAQKGGAA